VESLDFSANDVRMPKPADTYRDEIIRTHKHYVVLVDEY